MPYYEVKNQTILDELDKWQKAVKEQRKKAKKMMLEVQAKDYYLSYESGVVGFRFTKMPNERLWCQSKAKTPLASFMPRRNTKEGRELYKRVVQEIPKVSSEALHKACGFKDFIMIGEHIYIGPGLEVDNQGKWLMHVKEEVVMHEKYVLPEGLYEISLDEYLKRRKESDV